MQRADAVLCCGDLTDWGLSHQLKMVADTWRAVFPGDRRSDGAPITRLFLYGDHDNGGYAHHHFGSFEAAQRLYGFTAAEVEAMAIRQSGAARRWEEAFGEAYEPIFVREVKGYRFVLANFTMDGGAANPRGDNTPGAEARLAALARDPSKPFFYAQHRVYRGTMGGAEMTGLDDGRATAMLAQHPNCVAFCGHAHRTLTDEKMIWQGTFTAVEAPSLAYVTQANGRENARTIDEARARQGVTPLLPTYPMTVPEQGLLVSVWDDQISFERGVAQAMRGYKPMSVSHFGAPWCAGLTTSLPPVWPLATDAPEGILAGPGKPTLRAPLVVEDVPAGRLALHFGGVSEKVTVRVTGDGETLADVTLRPETNSPRWRSVAVHPKWKILQGDYVGVETVRVARAVKRLEIGLAAGDWCHLTGVRLTANDGRTALLRITPRFAPARRFARRFVGFDAAQPFAVADGTSAGARSDGASASAGADWLEANVFAPWDRLAARGVPVMMGEFGAFRRCPHAVARVWLEDNLRLLKRRGWSWALWNFRGTFGVLDSNREDVMYEDCDGHKLDRALLDLLQRY